MIVRCPACGAESSIDALIDSDDAAQALNLVLQFAPAGKLIVRYLALFRPAKRRLTWPRVASLLGELLPLIELQRIERDGRVHDAPLAAWASALEKTLQARDAGTLRTPLKGHGYLFEIVIAEATRAGSVIQSERDPAATTSQRGNSATARAIDTLNQRKRIPDATRS